MTISINKALALWQDRLIEQGQAEDPAEAEVWLEDLQRHNADYYQQRLGNYRKQVRDQLASAGDALKTLHQSSLETLQKLRGQDIGLIILDECHHLLGHWGRVLADAQELLEQPIVIGLTATPPDRGGKKPQDLERYDDYFGAIDYEVPVPAVVKDGFLAPYQDLAYFVRPAQDELVYIANADDELHAIIAELCGEHEHEHDGFETLPDWLYRVLSEYRLPIGEQKDWQTFARRDPDFADAARFFLLRSGRSLPANVPEPVSDLSAEEIPEMALLVPVLDRYVRHRLRPFGKLRRSSTGRASHSSAAHLRCADHRHRQSALRIASRPGDGVFAQQNRCVSAYSEKRICCVRRAYSRLYRRRL